jgi:hypothetical protein
MKNINFDPELVTLTPEYGTNQLNLPLILDTIEKGMCSLKDIINEEGIIILGASGEGKSTLLKYLARDKLVAEKKGYSGKMKI